MFSILFACIARLDRSHSMQRIEMVEIVAFLLLPCARCEVRVRVKLFTVQARNASTKHFMYTHRRTGRE